MMAVATILRKAPPRRGLTLQQRLEDGSMPVPECGCWIWLGARRAKRYGQLRFNQKHLAAHRAAWVVYRGEIPEGLHVLHKCDTPLCINPDHLFLGTHLDNMEDKETKGRGNHAAGERNGRHTKPERTSRGDDHYTRKQPGLKRGELNGRAKLTPADVISIRQWPGKQAAAARHFGVTKTTIRGIWLGKLWSHL